MTHELCGWPDQSAGGVDFAATVTCVADQIAGSSPAIQFRLATAGEFNDGNQYSPPVNFSFRRGNAILWHSGGL